MAHRFLRSIHTWPVPPNWSPRDWSRGIEGGGDRAPPGRRSDDFDPARGVSLGRLRPAASLDPVSESLPAGMGLCPALRMPTLEGSDDCDVAIDEGFSSIEISESLRTCLQRLPDPQRRLIEGLFWEEKTEVEVAGMLCLTQSGDQQAKASAFWSNSAVGWISSEKEKGDSAKD